ncbi:expressed unknown protein [Seminavis robusta]|uniref:Uncharacterized protein n=1 Tax=Seminavis robusta TaxID=568900 RepID=A0A9N8DYR5_9STRA|nr:expressed unknown protein [Seminavis robusta]|eukprot:Sro459_g147220.1 n/a (755) ;mRNA; r:7558-9822
MLFENRSHRSSAVLIATSLIVLLLLGGFRYDSVTTRNISYDTSTTKLDISSNSSIRGRSDIRGTSDETHIPLTANNGSRQAAPSVLRTSSDFPTQEGIIQRRYLFGIFSFDGGFPQYEKRMAIRNSYLSYYQQQEGNSSIKDTVCSLQELIQNPRSNDPYACRFVYTFVMGGGHPQKQPDICYFEECGNQTEDFVVPSPQYDVSEYLFKEMTLLNHTDFTFLRSRENHEEGKTESWYTYASSLTKDHPEFNLDYIGKLDDDTIMFVNRLLEEWQIQANHELKQQLVAGGWLVPKNICSKPRWGRVCDDPKFYAPYMLPGGFNFLSTRLAHLVYLDGTSLEHKKNMFFPGHEELGFSNLVFSVENVTASAVSQNSPGSHPFKTVDEMYNNYFKRSNCKRDEEFLAIPDFKAPPTPPSADGSPSPELIKRRYLFGIFTYDGGTTQYQQRMAIRNSYLSFYQNQATLDNAATKDTICSLQDLLENPRPEDPYACRFVYTFVMGGGHPQHRPDICYWKECGNQTKDFVLPYPEYNVTDVLFKEMTLLHHTDFTFLSTCENHEEGKTESWFTYAASLTRDRPELKLDYIGKLDDDTLVFVNRLLEEWQIRFNHELEQPLVAGGWLTSRRDCSKAEWGKVCDDPKFYAPYMLPGGFNFVSTKLAQEAFLEGTSLEHKKKMFFPGHEDMSFSNLVFSVGNVTTSRIAAHSPGSHPFKTTEHMYKNYFKRCDCQPDMYTLAIPDLDSMPLPIAFDDDHINQQ